MSGKRITAQQRAFYMKFRQQDMTQSISAAKAGISERSARRIEKNTSSKSSSSKSRTPKDPFETVMVKYFRRDFKLLSLKIPCVPQGFDN